MTMNLKICSVLALCVGLAGCGGGGDSAGPTSSPTPAPAPAPAPAAVVLDPLTSVPAPTYGDARDQAFNRVNEIRRQVGLGLLAQNDRLDLAAQRHADYLAYNYVELSHLQIEGLPGFTGVHAINRATSAGYAAGLSSAPTVDETIIPELPNADLGRTIDYFMAMPYHRIPYLNHANIDIGMGRRLIPGSRADIYVTDFGYHAGRRQGSPATPFVVWPQPNSTIDRLDTPFEIPPPPGRGFAPSIHVDPSRVLKVESFEMRGAGGVLVPATILSTATDPVLLGRPYAVLLSPTSALTAATRYSVRFAGTSNGQPLNYEWSFNTP